MRLKAADLAWADIALLGRLDSWYELQITKKLHAAGKTLIYIMDDDLLNIPDEVTSASYYHQECIRQSIREIIGLSDAILSPNPLLLERYAGGKTAIRTEEPALRPAPFTPHPAGRPVKIWFMGSPDRTGDLERILREALAAIRKEYAAMKAGKESAGTAASHAVGGGAKAAQGAGKAVKEGMNIGTWAVNFVKSHGHVLLVLGGLLLVILIVAGSISSCSVFMQGGTNVVIDTSYTAEDADILGAEEDYADLEAELQSRIDNIRTEYDGYDEYNISCDQIGHNPYELASYLTVMFENYKRNEVQGVLQDLFDLQYELEIEEVVETRYRTETVTETDTYTDPETGETETDTYTYEIEVPYDYYILNVTLKNKSMGTAISESGLNEDKMQRYALLMQTYGNKPELFAGNPNAIQVQDVLHYDIPGEALTDERFRKMITEAEKYLGYPYVWGGASPSTSFDCSGFVSWVINHCGNGWNYGRLTAEGLRQVCDIIPASEAKPGDLVFFQGTYNTSGASHVAIYVGDNTMLHCGNPIQYARFDTPYWRQHFYCFGRIR